jgi:hypothetical protein
MGEGVGWRRGILKRFEKPGFYMKELKISDCPRGAVAFLLRSKFSKKWINFL